jgi:hypothetical protein
MRLLFLPFVRSQALPLRAIYFGPTNCRTQSECFSNRWFFGWDAMFAPRWSYGLEEFFLHVSHDSFVSVVTRTKEFHTKAFGLLEELDFNPKLSAAHSRLSWASMGAAYAGFRAAGKAIAWSKWASPSVISPFYLTRSHT